MVPILLCDLGGVHLCVKAILIDLCLHVQVNAFFLLDLLLLFQKHALDALADVINDACHGV